MGRTSAEQIVGGRLFSREPAHEQHHQQNDRGDDHELTVDPDSAILARLTLRERLELLALDALLTRRRQLRDMLVAEKNRLGFARPVVRRGITQQIRWLERRVIEQFSQTQMAQRHIALYKRILEGKTAAGDSGKQRAISS